jgi:hypothetical protein
MAGPDGWMDEWMNACMHKGWAIIIRHLHCDPQWSIVLPLFGRTQWNLSQCSSIHYRFDNDYLGYEDLKPRTMKSTVFWVVPLCGSETDHHFRGTYRLHLQGWSVSQAWNQHKQVANSAKLTLLPATGFLFGFFFNLEDGGTVFPWNNRLSLNCVTIQKDRTLWTDWSRNEFLCIGPEANPLATVNIWSLSTKLFLGYEP